MPKDTNSATHERSSSFVSLLSGWVQQGVESFFATQRILVDLAMRQNTNAMNTIREELSQVDVEESKDSPRSILIEMAVEGTANYIEAQRILLDLAQQENEIVMNGVGERVGKYGPAVAMTNVLRRGVETFIDMQQNLLTITSKRTQGLLKNSDKDKAGINPVSMAAEAMEEFVAAQKKFLDVISEETRSDKKEHPGRKPTRTEITELGREAANSFIEAQKKLLDLAGQQVNVSMQAASRAADLKMPIRLMPVADMAGDGVKSFVDAEKALVDSITKTRNRPKVTVTVKATPAAKRTKAKAPRATAAKAPRAKAAKAPRATAAKA